MSIATSTVDGVFAVLWGVPRAADYEKILSGVDALLSERDPVSYVAVMPDAMPRIDDAQRKGLMRLTEALVDRCDAVCVIIEAQGFRGAIMRSMLTAVNLVTRRHDRVRFVDSDAAALEFLASRADCDPDAITLALHELRQQQPE